MKDYNIDYDELVNKKEDILVDISSYLNLQKSSFSSMKQDAEQKNIGTSHFREGKTSSNREKLSEFHKIQLKQMIKVFTPEIYENTKKIKLSKILKHT